MTEKPIIFSAPMVRAILDGRKSMTRRIVKPQPEYRESKSLLGHYATWANGWNIDDPIGLKAFVDGCPYGGPGDRLWVRESYLPDPPRDGSWPSTSWEDAMRPAGIPDRFKSQAHCLYRASWDGGLDIRWKPSIHMPRWASRITLEIVSVKVERLNDISINDVLEEGTELGSRACYEYIDGIPVACYPEPDEAATLDNFIGIWESIHSPGSWALNPWCWCIEFRVIR